MENFTDKPDLGEYNPNQFFDVASSPFDIEQHQLFNVVSGSRAYGTNTPTSDIDIRGVVMPPEKYFFGLGNFEQADNQKKDVTFYSVKKFFELALKNNVHALEMLWMPERTVNYVHPLFKQVIDAREHFMSRRLGYTCGGYAFQQVKLMYLKKVNNTGRQDLIEKHGFDTKMGAHALRILRMGTEALQTGKLNVYRPDRDELMEIKNGKYKLHEMGVIGKDNEGKDTVVSGMLADEFQKFYEAWENSPLLKEPDYNYIERLLIKTQKDLLGLAE
jgi:predicted nucleotidyltransferase